MKRQLYILLAFVFLITALLPGFTQAASIDKGLQSAIIKAKSIFDIPEDYKFTPGINNENGKNIYSLNWASKSGDNTYINIRIDDKGLFLGYEKYNPSDYTGQQRKLPKISRQVALEKAEAFVKKVNPSFAGKYKYQDAYQNTLGDPNYYLNFYRVENGIPYYNNNFNVTVNKETGNIQSFYASWNSAAVFPKESKIISLKAAQKAYKSEIGLKLIYKYNYTDQKIKPYLVYIPSYDNENYSIDAFTGKKIKLGTGFYPMYSESGNMFDKAKLTEASQQQLNPDELKAIQDAAGLKTIEEVEKIARAAAFLGLSDKFTLDSYNLYPSWPDNTKYFWNLMFNKKAEDNSAGYFINVGVDAKAGLIMSFYTSSSNGSDETVKFKLEDMKAEFDKFIKENYPAFYEKVSYDEQNEEVQKISGGEVPRFFDIRYTRIENGIAFPDNSISGGYDAVSGKINSFNITWFDAAFPSASKVLAIDNIYDRLFMEIGLELSYKPEFINNAYYTLESQENAKIRLVYSLKPSKPAIFNANTGVILDYQGAPYKEQKPVTYSDIGKSYAKKEITMLAENGVYLDGTLFKPQAGITQKDFLVYLSKTLNYYGSVIIEKSTKKDIDDLYAFMLREGIVKQSEVSRDSYMKREDAVKFIIRAMKYDKIADKKNLLRTSIRDMNKATPSLYGYIALAAGLDIIKRTGSFNPKGDLSREAAAVMIYNYLQI